MLTYSLITNDSPFRRRQWIQDQHSVVALVTVGHSVLREGVGTGRMRTLVACHALLHVFERRIVVTIRTQRVALERPVYRAVFKLNCSPDQLFDRPDMVRGIALLAG